MNQKIITRIHKINDQEALHIFFDALQILIEKLNLSPEDERLALNVRNDSKKRFSININSRMVFGLKDGSLFYIMINSEDLLQLVDLDYLQNEEFQIQTPKANLLLLTKDYFKKNKDLLLKLWLKSCGEYVTQGEKSPYRKYNIPDFYKMVVNPNIRKQYFEKTDELQEIVNRYKHKIEIDGMDDERYKWVLVNQYQGRPNLDNPNLYDELKSIDYSNLMYPIGKGVIYHLAREKPLEYKRILENLFHEDVDLASRIQNLNYEVMELYRQIVPDKPHHHDERTASTLLTFRSPDKYVFFKDSFYKKFCKIIDENPAKKNFKFQHYLEILDDFIKNYIQEDDELLNLVYSKLSENAYKNDQHRILAQDILYRMLDSDTFSDPVAKDIIISEPKTTKMKFPLNQILFGPPGTGKTYKLKSDYFDKYTIRENSVSQEEFFEEVVTGLTWWQVIALAIIEKGTSKVNELRENRWIVKKAQLSESKNVNATIWGTLQMHTIVDSTTVKYTQRQSPFIFNKTDEKKWELLESEVSDQAPELQEILKSVNEFKPNPEKEIKHYVFTTFHQSFSYEDFIEGIKPVMEEGKENLSYKIENGIFKELCVRAQNNPNYRYAIFIDEINRGNVSQIFGELITLIESDKRLGAENEMKIRLPYSKKDFGVPSNVDIIGTMNTADRSVEALDTALRRRFSFEEMPPKYDLLELENEIFKIKAADILKTINQRIEKLLDRDHCIGHAYLLNKDEETLQESFYKNIIPLLQEYFFGDFGKIGLVLGEGFVKKSTNNSDFADFDYSDFQDYAEKDLFEIVDYRNSNTNYFIKRKGVGDVEMNFKKAIQLLMKHEIE